MPRSSGRLRPLIAGIAVIVILLVVVPRNSSAQTAGSLVLGEVTHSADGTVVASLGGTPEDFASLEVLLDGESVPFELSDASGGSASRIVFAVENSVSMVPTQLAEVQSAMSALVATLSAADEVGVVTFGGGASVLLEPTTDRAAFDAAINTIALDGGSALYSGVATAAELAAGPTPSLVVLVTYGWDWGSVSTHTRDASITAVADAGSAVYVQSMVFDGSVDVGYLAPLATDGVLRDATQIAAISGATSLIGASQPPRTLTITAPPLALGSHELSVTSALSPAQLAPFEVSNDGLVTLAATPGTEPTDPIAIHVTGAAGLSALELSVTVDGEPVPIGPEGTITVDPWSFAPGTIDIGVTASTGGAVAAVTSRTVAIPSLEPMLSVDQSNESTLSATLRSQPGAATALVAILDGSTLAESTTGSLQVDRPATGTLTFEASVAGEVIASEEVSATEVVEPVVPTPPSSEQSGGSSLLSSPTIFLVPLALLAIALLLIRRRSEQPLLSPEVTGTAAERRSEIEPNAAFDAPESVTPAEIEPVPVAEIPRPEIEPAEIEPLAPPEPLEFAPVEAESAVPIDEVVAVDEGALLDEVAPIELPDEETEPTPLPATEESRPSKSRFSMFDRKKSVDDGPAQPTHWSVLIRSADGFTRRVEVGYEPVSIGASKLCTVTLDGDTVRFVHLVIAREGHEVRAHQFGPVIVDGQEQNVEDGTLLTQATLEIGDVAIWLEPAAAESAAVDAA